MGGTTLDVILQARAKDKGLARFLNKNTKLADALAEALDKVSKAGGSLDGIVGGLPDVGGGRRRRPRGGGAGGGELPSSGPVASDPMASATGRARRRRAGSSSASGDDSGARAGSERAARARQRVREQTSEERVLAQARRRGERRARMEVDRGTEDRLGGGRRRKAGKAGRGRMEFAANASIAAAEWENFGNDVRTGLDGAFTAFKDYEKGVSEVTTVTDQISVDEIKSITQGAALEFGGLPTDQVSAFYEIVSAGATDAATATDQLRAANILAIGGQADAASAVTAISKGVANFKAEGATTTDVMDSLFVAVQRGQTDVDGMAKALPRVAEAASSSGLSLDETNAALAVLSLKLPSAEEGATSLKSAFSNIQKPTKAARKEAKRLGIDFSVAGIKAAGGFDQFLLKLRAAEKFDDNTLAKLFDSSEARAAMGGLMNDMETFQSVLGDMDKKEGASAKAYDKMADTTSQKTAKMEAQWEILKITAGESLVPALTELAKEVGPVITEFTAWIKENPKLAGGIAKVAIGVAGLSLVIGPALSAISLISSTAGLAAPLLGKFGPASASAGKGIGGLTTKVTGLTPGVAALAVAAFAFGAAIGTWLDHEFGVSDFLADTLTKVTGLKDHLEKVEKLTPKFIKHEGKSENDVLMAQRARLVEAKELTRKNATGTATPLDWIDEVSGTADVKRDQHSQAVADLRRFDMANAEKLGISEERSFANTDIASALVDLARSIDGFKQNETKRAPPANPTWTGPSMEAGLS